jgi:hypothetical protein
MALWFTDGQGQQRYYDTNFTVSHKSFAFTIPIEVEHNQIYLTLEFQGRPYRFKLDTGASQGVIYDDVVLGGQKEVGYIRSEDATGKSQQVTTIELPTFRIGQLEVSGYKVQKLHRFVARHGEDGIIGFALFHKGIAAKIDTRSQQMTITDIKNLFIQEQGEILKYRLRRHVPYIKISPFEGIEEEVLFDTGSALPYAINEKIFAQMAYHHPAISEQIEGSTYGSRTIGHFGTERPGRIFLLGLTRLMWGKFAYNDVHCTTIHGGSHVGAKLLQYGALIINPFRRQLILQPYDNQMSCMVSNRQHNIVIVENEGRAMVGMVLNNSRAWADGFRQGQVIEQVDGSPISFEQFLRFRWVKDTKYKFTMNLPQGTRETIQALWPFQYNF